ncbi:hypothetical protein SAMCCGM7_Ch3594 [Sinorhizobium americanum CCGM7]|nr:hypothetical protein SAMCCGM7_Ch3594 [Sinorhizobium americanum CCGM7]
MWNSVIRAPGADSVKRKRQWRRTGLPDLLAAGSASARGLSEGENVHRVADQGRDGSDELAHGLPSRCVGTVIARTGLFSPCQARATVSKGTRSAAHKSFANAISLDTKLR